MSTKTKKATPATVESYGAMKARHEREVNALPIKYAFSREQFDEICAEWGITDPKAELYKFGSLGAFYRKSDSALIRGTFKRHDAEMDEAMRNEGFAVSAFCYEASNHEFQINLDPHFDMANCFGYPYDRKEDRIMWEKVPNGKFLAACYSKGVGKHLDWCRKHNAY